MPLLPLRLALLLAFALLTGCASDDGATKDPDKAEILAAYDVPLHPNETEELRLLINRYALLYDVPPALVHRVVIRESTHRPGARNGPYYGLMQI